MGRDWSIRNGAELNGLVYCQSLAENFTFFSLFMVYLLKSQLIARGNLALNCFIKKIIIIQIKLKRLNKRKKTYNLSKNSFNMPG